MNYVRKIQDKIKPPTPPAPPVEPGTLVPKKLPHGAQVALIGKEKETDISMSGVKVRVLEIAADAFMNQQAKKAGCVRAANGKMVADDWVNTAGQVMVFQYWTLGTSKISAKSVENPVAIKQDSRVWYTSCAPA